VSNQHEWSRSRFWLCHFLHNRHVRLRIEWNRPIDPPGEGLPASLRAFLTRAGHFESPWGPWLVRQGMRRWTGDPAYVQSLRLLVKEQRFHRQLVEQLLEVMTPSSEFTAGRGKTRRPALGMRFELSVLFIEDLLTNSTLEVLVHAAGGLIGQVCSQIVRDRAAHLAFVAERLTMEYAAFNFVRRNLRRARLRAMFEAALMLRLRENRRLLYDCNLLPRVFAGHCRARFRQWLERMVPYHREVLLQSLLQQAEKPFDPPQGLRRI